MNRLQETRMLLGLTQPQVSAKLKSVEPRADVGMVSRYEKGVCLPTKDQLAALEDLYGVPRTELFDLEDLDLVGTSYISFAPPQAAELTHSASPPLPTGTASLGPDVDPDSAEKMAKMPPPSHAGRFRKCYRISREFTASLPDDLLQVCGYSSWQSWHDAALKRLLAEYAARSRGIKKKQDPAESPAQRVSVGEDEQRIGADAPLQTQGRGAERSL